MNWLFYSFVYCVACILAIAIIRRKNKRFSNQEFGIQEWAVLVLVAPLGILLSPIWIPFVLREHFRTKLKYWIEEREEKRKERKLKARIGLRPNEDYLSFSRMGGVGVVKCVDCGYHEKIISFTHGTMSCTIGRQCPNCHSFVCEYNESQEFHTFGDAKEDFVCPKCGTLIRKKEEDILKGNDDPLFCTMCHSAKLRYYMIYIT